MPWPGRIAVTSLCAAVALVLVPDLTLPLDAALHRAVQGVRSCRLVEGLFVIDVVVRCLLGGVLAGVFARERARAVAPFLILAGIAIAGGATGELLKTVFERMRPNQAPGDLSGNSFPSGHVMNTTLAAVAVTMWIVKLEWRRGHVLAVAALGGAGVLAEAAYRVLNGSHWASDTIGSVLLGVAWMLGAEVLRPSVSWRSLGAAAAAFATLYAVFYEIPDLRVRLRSALDREKAAIASLELGQPSAALLGEWSHGWREPVGGVSWVRAREVGIELAATVEPRLVRLTLRPPSTYESAEGCVRIRVTIDGDAETVTLLTGWREYHFAPPPGAWTAAKLRIRLTILDDVRPAGGTAPGMLAVHDVRLE